MRAMNTKAAMIPLVLALIGLLALACEDSEDVSQAESGQIEPSGDQVFVTFSADEIAATIEGFVEAIGNGDNGALEGYWSETCAEDLSQSLVAAELLREVLGEVSGGGRYDLKIEPGRLRIRPTFNYVAVPLDQPEGVLKGSIGEIPFGEEADPLLVKSPLVLVREDDDWRVATCDITGDEEDEEEES